MRRLRIRACSIIIEQGAMEKMGRQLGAGPRMTVVEVLHALADPVRLEIVRQLHLEGEKACGSFGIDMAKSSLSHHFGVLREAGVIASESQGTVVMNRLQRRELAGRFPGLLESVLNASHNPPSRPCTDRSSHPLKREQVREETHIDTGKSLHR